jgi:putative toxin-antitoxin system antitoxin component (TIGR02293 family)
MPYGIGRQESPVENIALIRQYLGGTTVIGSPQNELDFVPIIRKGFPFSVFTSLRDRAKLSEETIWASLRIAKRTAARRKERAERLKSDESELLFRLARVLAAGTEVLGSEQNARDWLLAGNRALGGGVPIELLDTGIGFQEVMDVLKRIEHGVYS